MKKWFLVVCCLSIFSETFSQSISIRPYLGLKKVWSSQKGMSANNFDPTFSSKSAYTNQSVGIALEYNHKAMTYELCFTAQGSEFNLSSSYKEAGINIQYETGFGFNQIQGICNYSLLKHDNPDKNYNITPIFSVGAGLGFLPSQSYFDSDPYIERFSTSNNPNEFFDVNFTIKRLHNVSYSGIFKAGFLIHSPTKEIFRIQLIANLGLNEAFRGDLIYYHTTKKYSGTLPSYGSHIGILGSVPICIKRFKKR